MQTQIIRPCHAPNDGVSASPSLAETSCIDSAQPPEAEQQAAEQALWSWVSEGHLLFLFFFFCISIPALAPADNEDRKIDKNDHRPSVHRCSTIL